MLRTIPSSPAKRPGLQPRKSITRRESSSTIDVPSSPSGASSSALQQAPRIPTKFSQKNRSSSPLAVPPDIVLDHVSAAAASTSPSTPPRVPPPAELTTTASPKIPSPVTRTQGSPLPPQDDTELQELRAKIRVLEAKRTDDTRHIRELEHQLEEAKNFIAVKPKLQLKLNQLQQDLISTRRELSDTQQLSQLAESRVLDAQEQLEIALLDKEMAEEKAETAETELEELKENLAVIQVEIEVLKGEQGTLSRILLFFWIPGLALTDSIKSGPEAPGKNSLAFIQLEKQNERLKEALIKYQLFSRFSVVVLTMLQASRPLTRH